MSTVYFPAAGITFLRELEQNNRRDWFESRRARFDADVKAPAAFLADAIAVRLGERLGTSFGHKIFRLHRDVRFSKDKTPYNTYLRFAFWPASADTAEVVAGPAFYMSIETGRHVCGAGAIHFGDEKLARFRTRVSSAKHATEAAALMSGLAQSGITFAEPELKRPPAGMVALPENASLIRRKSLVAWHEMPIGDTPEDIRLDNCLRRFELVLPAFNWVQAL
ncbi:MAG: DUF2461 domain-containing protein [Alphaproteobacteria bacterium]|nr:MAG: DUF2461 domain-containing protein [Alphaproteobacteria bacterium]